jgi:pyridoxal phosphate enzyme (YggS family)
MGPLLSPADLGAAPGDFLRANLRLLEEEIAASAEGAGRAPESIQLLAVTKYVDSEVIRLLYQSGVRDVGESRVQPLVAKAADLEDLDGLRFHLIGHLQRNKARRALEVAASIHSLDSPRLVTELESRLEVLAWRCPELYVEVNISGEDQKTGLPVAELPALLSKVAACPHLDPALRGLMAMAPYHPDPERARPCFRRLRELRDEMQERGLLPAGAGLSMGMSGDFRVAIEEGATVVRVGSRIFER